MVWNDYGSVGLGLPEADGDLNGVFGGRFEIPIVVAGMESGEFSGWSSVFPAPGP